MMPVARVMALYRQHSGREAVSVTEAPEGLDVTASRSGDRFYLHVVNTLRERAVQVEFAVEGRTIEAGIVHQIAADPELEVWAGNAEVLAPTQRELVSSKGWTVPPASVSAIELVARAVA
jgi:hypothetical protein